MFRGIPNQPAPNNTSSYTVPTEDKKESVPKKTSICTVSTEDKEKFVPRRPSRGGTMLVKPETDTYIGITKEEFEQVKRNFLHSTSKQLPKSPQ